VNLSLQDHLRWIEEEPDKRIHATYLPGPLKYLWHYNYDGLAKNVMCDIRYVDGKCLKYVKPWNRDKEHKHTITWYLKADNWVSSDNDFSLKWNDFMKAQGSLKHMSYFKTVCFGPLMNNISKDSKETSVFRVRLKVSAYYYFTFTGLRSKCPGSADLKVTENSHVEKSELPTPTRD
jgi:hypothetical protein